MGGLRDPLKSPFQAPLQRRGWPNVGFAQTDYVGTRKNPILYTSVLDDRHKQRAFRAGRIHQDRRAKKIRVFTIGARFARNCVSFLSIDLHCATAYTVYIYTSAWRCKICRCFHHVSPPSRHLYLQHICINADGRCVDVHDDDDDEGEEDADDNEDDDWQRLFGRNPSQELSRKNMTPIYQQDPAQLSGPWKCSVLETKTKIIVKHRKIERWEPVSSLISFHSTQLPENLQQLPWYDK